MTDSIHQEMNFFPSHLQTAHSLPREATQPQRVQVSSLRGGMGLLTLPSPPPPCGTVSAPSARCPGQRCVSTCTNPLNLWDQGRVVCDWGEGILHGLSLMLPKPASLGPEVTGNFQPVDFCCSGMCNSDRWKHLDRVHLITRLVPRRSGLP